LLAATLLVTATAATRLYVRADRAMHAVEAEVAAAVSAEAWTRNHAPADLPAWIDPSLDKVWQTSLLTPAPTPVTTTAALDLAAGTEVRHMEVRGEHALVEVVVTAPEEPWLPAPYRQSRAYRETPDGWRRSAPAAVFWQPTATHRAGRFVFVYGPRDTAAVLDAADRIVALDRALRGDLGLPPARQSLTVRVDPALPPTLDPAHLDAFVSALELRVPSPALLALPPGLAEGDALRMLVGETLAARTVDEAVGDAAALCNWSPLRLGMRLWLQAQVSDLPSPSRYMRAVVPESQQPGAWARFALRAGGCGGPDEYPYLFSMANEGGANTLLALVEYIVATYGCDRLSPLVAGMDRHPSWATLAPAVLGVEQDAFEAGWTRYLEKAWAPDPSPPAQMHAAPRPAP
jgi:hypothetical protein